ncbi:ATP-binding protein [uncultured Bacteroides sp.]|uniref:PAS domain-containing hybrid sensor histidine kinase/response regulator n=1 Tax=uncultured Bacteroides sp. TaxID=162156 RepID=UPI002AA6828F|nr:ATP-binding protein [uncultured Bacteroides sp.]
MKRILHEPAYSDRILQLTADTMLLVDAEGICRDITTHSDLWFLQEDILIGKNLFEIMPEHTYEKIYPEFMRVLNEKEVISKNYKLPLKSETLYFKCIMYPFNEMVLCQYRDITKRCNIRLELENANKKLKEIQKTALIGLWIYDIQTGIVTFHGYTNLLSTEKKQQISFDDYLNFVVEEDRENLTEWLINSATIAEDDSLEFRVHYYDGEIHYLRAKKLAIALGENEEITSVEGYSQNITSIRRQRNDINLLTHAIDNATEDIFAVQRDGTLIFANQQFRKHHKIPEHKELADINVNDMPYGIISKEQWKEIFSHQETKNNKYFVSENPFPDDKKILAYEHTVYYVTSDDSKKTIWALGHDISERIRYEAEIKKFNLTMDITMKNLPASIVVKDVENDFKYLYRNREADNRSIASDRAVGKSDFDYYPDEIARKKREEDIELVKSRKEIHCIREERDSDGKLTVLDRRKTMIESKDFSPIIVSIEWDITQLELMKREVLASKEKAEASDRLKSAFLANMSHEIRTPLNAIVGFSRIIADSDNMEERKEYFNIVEANNERLLQLINEILDLSKIESGMVEFSLTNIKLHTLCREIFDAHVFRCPEGVKFLVEESDVSLEITSDKNRIFQVFSNLIGNAFKFVKEGSIRYGYRKEGQYVVFYVTDTGIGIPENKMNNIFDRFVKVNNFDQGTGLGLSICRTIVERLGGDISVSSVAGQGSTFSFTLPCNSDEEVKKEKETKDTEIVDHFKMETAMIDKKEEKATTILVAEDTDSNFELLNAILGKTYQLLRAKDGIEAIKMFEETNPDLILMDIKMPNMDGLSATKIIRGLSLTIPIIALSAYAYADDIKAAKEAGCNEFLTKPLSQVKLKDALKTWLDNR